MEIRHIIQYIMRMMILKRLKSGHWGIDGRPVYLIVAQSRRELNQSKGYFAKANGIPRASQYEFEDGKNKSFEMAARQLRAIGYSVHLEVTT
jgi:hypothetical protein